MITNYIETRIMGAASCFCALVGCIMLVEQPVWQHPVNGLLGAGAVVFAYGAAQFTFGDFDGRAGGE